MEIIKTAIEEPLKKLGLTVFEIKYFRAKPNTLYITLDSDEIMNIDKIVEATKIISPIIDENNFIKEQYVLDVSSREKGGNE